MIRIFLKSAAGLLILIVIVTTYRSVQPNKALDQRTDIVHLADQNTSTQLAATFLEAWSRQDYSTMYDLITPNARAMYSQSAFVEAYQSIWRDLELQSLKWEQKEVSTHGTTVLFNYDLTFTSANLGQFTDSNRLIRFVPSAEGMRIAWSLMDIFEDWTSGTRLRVEYTLPPRGNIYDSQGHALATQDGTAVAIYLARNRIPDEGRCIDELKALLGRDVSDLAEFFGQYNPDTEFFVGNTDYEILQTHAQVLQSVCRPTNLIEHSTRRYFGSIAPHLIGYVGSVPAEQADQFRDYPSDALVGLMGIESSWEAQLRGTIGSRFSLFSLTNDPIRVIAEQPSIPGQDIYLTIDRELQQSIVQAFADAYALAESTWASTSLGAAAVVLDVNTGAVLAMVSYPGFDPEVFNPHNLYFDPLQQIQSYQLDPRRPMLNHVTQAQLPLGSVFKLISSIGGADSGVVPINTTFACNDKWYGEEFGDSLPYRTDWYTGGRGMIDGKQAIIYSCNPYYWQLAVSLDAIDPNLLPKYASLFGLGQYTGINGVEEEPGFIPSPLALQNSGQTWSLPFTLNLVIGQGEVMVNPLQVVRMVAAIANGGNLFTPYVVQQVARPNEAPSFVSTPEFSALDVNPEVLAEVRDAMCKVTTEGTAEFIFSEWYVFQTDEPLICGKTGTAQSSETQPPHAWFVSFAPADNPEIAVVVVVENSCEGSEVAAPLARRIYEIYYDLPQSEWPPLWETGCTPLEVGYDY
ncbi:MAG: penicillin-binding protein 2 [Chloroflexota bacterium]|nr:MAG: penicillin-binding protein 2 [Chloroflexota bacterium]